MPTEEKIFTLKATLLGSKPAIWRTLEVPETLTVHELHLALQGAFGWNNSHLSDFEIGKHRYATPDAEEPEGSRDSHAYELGQVLKKRGQKFTYTYDYGDDWKVELLYSGLGTAEEGVTYPRCTGGARAGPPDDSGGIYGYQERLKSLKDPKAEDHDDLVEWFGEKFDPERFSIEETNLLIERAQLLDEQPENEWPEDLPEIDEEPLAEDAVYLAAIGPAEDEEHEPGDRLLYCFYDGANADDTAREVFSVRELKEQLPGLLGRHKGKRRFCNDTAYDADEFHPETLGFELAPLPEDVAFDLSLLAWTILLGPQKPDASNPEAVVQLLAAISNFTSIVMNTVGPKDTRFKVMITKEGVTTEKNAVALMESTYGVQLFDKPEAMDESDPQLVMQIETEPDWIGRLLDAALEIPGMPIVARLEDDKLKRLKKEETTELTAVINAVAIAVEEDGKGEVEIEGVKVRVEFGKRATES